MKYIRKRVAKRTLADYFAIVPSGKTISVLTLLLVVLAVPVTVFIMGRQTHFFQHAASTGHIYYVSKNGTDADGTSWQTAWNELNQINWSVILPGDTITLDGGTTGMTYTSQLIVGKSGVSGLPITIVRSTDPSHNGQVAIFGGRSTLLPYTGQTNYVNQTQGVQLNGILFGDNGWIILDGTSWHGIHVYGYNASSIVYGANSHDITVSNMEVNDNGEAEQGSDGTWSTIYAGINLHGNNHTLERVDVHDNGEDSFQPNNINNLTIRQSWLHETRSLPSYPGTSANLGGHNDGIQVYAGNPVSGITLDQDIFGPGHANDLIVGNGIVPISNVQLTNSLFLDARANNIYFEPISNITIDHVTSFAQADNLILSTPSGGRTITNSIFYGGYMGGNPTSASNNCQWNINGGSNPAITGQTVDPQFVSDLSIYPNETQQTSYRTAPSLDTLNTVDLSLKSSSPCAGRGSSITSVSQFLNMVNSTPIPTTSPTSLTPTSTTASATSTPAPISQTPTPPSTGNLIIYDNAVANSFNDFSYGIASSMPCDTSMFISSPCSYAITFNPSGALNLHVVSGALNTGGYQSFVWNMNTNGQPVADFKAFFTDSTANAITIVPVTTVNVIGTPATGWVTISIPVSQLNPQNVLVRDIQIQNASGQTLSPVHFDDIILKGTSPTGIQTPTFTPSLTQKKKRNHF